jgi:hypothetical protein
MYELQTVTEIIGKSRQNSGLNKSNSHKGKDKKLAIAGSQEYENIYLGNTNLQDAYRKPTHTHRGKGSRRRSFRQLRNIT